MIAIGLSSAARTEGTAPQSLGRLYRLLRWCLPNGGTLLLVAALILTQQVWARPLLSPDSAPGPSATIVNYQGRLADIEGNPLDGTYGMTFALYDAPTGGALMWGPESHAAVPVSDGLFSVGLGNQTRVINQENAPFAPLTYWYSIDSSGSSAMMTWPLAHLVTFALLCS